LDRIANEEDPRVTKSNKRSVTPPGADDRGMILPDGWDALEVAKMSLGAFRHNHTAEPVTSALTEVREATEGTSPPGA
jgi:hypothetical protein